VLRRGHGDAVNDHLSPVSTHQQHVEDPREPGCAASPAPTLLVGDVCVRRDDTGFGIFNYRGERVLEEPVDSCAEAARLAREIVMPWQGRVLVDDPSQR
jgi:hypothetical protein